MVRSGQWLDLRSTAASSGRAALFVGGLTWIVGSSTLFAQVSFQEVGAARGIQPATLADGMGVGLAAADFNDDGFVDFFVPTAAGLADLLYSNQGNGQFMEIAADVSLTSTDMHRAALWFDFDGDQDLDLFLTNDDQSAPTAYELFEQEEDGRLKSATVQAGLFMPQANPGSIHRGGQCAGDLNRDGYLDLLAASWNGPLHVFLNNQDGTFEDISVSSGIGADWEWYHQPVLADFNGDGWPDVYVAVDFGPNRLWINQKDGTFQEVAAAAGADNIMNDMGVAIGDYDNDGDPDLYVTNIYNIDPQTLQPEYSILLRNDSVGQALQFVDVAVQLGVDNTGWGWGVSFLDCNNDGWLDIGVTNGWRAGKFATDPSRLFLNSGSAPFTFSDESSLAGFNDTFYGASLVAFDFDRDGDLDAAQTTMAVDAIPSSIRLLENSTLNPPQTANYLVIKPRMDGPNYLAIGSTCRVLANGVTMTRYIQAGTSYLGQEPAEAFFGMGSAAVAQQLTISWADGSETVLASISANQVLVVNHGGFGDLDADGAVGLSDHALLLNCLSGPILPVPDVCLPADLNADRTVDLADHAVFQRRFSGS